VITGMSKSIDWSDAEVALLVEDYFAMLDAELQGESVNKAARRRALIPRLNGRSAGAIEFKHCNLSAVLCGMKLPYIDGYKPRFNYQRSLETIARIVLERNPRVMERWMDAPRLNPINVPPVNQGTPTTVFVDPPSRSIQQAMGEKRNTIDARFVDFAMLDAQNRRLGRMGEEFVLDIERHCLRVAGRADLAARVEWSSRDLGDGLGYDIRSYDAQDESECLIEVKTTCHGASFPFYVTRNEVAVSIEQAPAYRLYRLHHFSTSPRIFTLEGALPDSLTLDPAVFTATI
jgi:hypothetical protein